ncbi:hypothetical protein Mgra_00004111 [Meloidogyne graminicola]|uniref:Uncharacterized protein n=1 Tax=Meloidogyne graminicola TaxID=189291 RepID=A0A8S9ZST1_9BILA|nr:hypothetical protein Mgra_00004111 [Meloidogyne graminicola]
MIRTQEIDPVYLIIGAFLFVFFIVYISLCIYCFRMKQLQKRKKLVDSYYRNLHKFHGKTLKENKNKTKKGGYKVGAKFSLKSGSRRGSKVSPIPSGALHGVAVPMTIDTIDTISGENLLADDQGFKESTKDKKRNIN